jgi:hypothetical protein
MDKQRRIFGISNPIDEDFLAALADMPDASGAALGFDRLIMLVTGAKRVESVQWTPVFDPIEAGTVRNLVFGAIVAPMEGEYGDQEGHVGSAFGGP